LWSKIEPFYLTQENQPTTISAHFYILRQTLSEVKHQPKKLSDFIVGLASPLVGWFQMGMTFGL